MALHFPLLLNTHSIGYFYAQRIDGNTEPNSRGLYNVEIEHNGKKWTGQVVHRYGDGAWVLVRKALQKFEKRHADLIASLDERFPE